VASLTLRGFFEVFFASTHLEKDVNRYGEVMVGQVTYHHRIIIIFWENDSE